MSLWPFALLDVDGARLAARVTGADDNTRLEDASSEASRLIEGFWGRHLVSRGVLTEYHPRVGMRLGSCELFPNEWPVWGVISVVEAGITLVAGTDYRLVKVPAS